MKRFAYFAAVSVAVIAQAASGQDTQKTINLPTSVGTPVNKTGNIKAVTPSTATAVASVTMTNGMVWSFNGSRATVNGVSVIPSALKVGMNCALVGTSGTPTGNLITSLACK